MGRFNHWTWLMNIRDRLIDLRHERNLTQQEMADAIGVHVNQIRRYEAGATQPSLDVLKKLATSMNVTIDSLVFGEGERDPTDDLRLQFEAVSRMPEEEKRIVKALLEGMIVKYQTKQMIDGLSR